MKISGNKGLPILAGLVVVTVTILVLIMGDNNNTQHKYAAQPDKRHNQLDGDMPEHTLNTLATNMAEFKSLMKGNKELVQNTTDQYDQLRREIESLKERDRKLSRELLKEKNKKGGGSKDSSSINVSELADRVLDRIKPRLNSEDNKKDPRTGYPVGGANGANQVTGSTRRIRSQYAKQVNLSEKAKSIVPDLLTPPTLGKSIQPVGGSRAKNVTPPTPVYTIPDLSILDGAVTVTHMIGRVPIKGDVTDPAPFKIVVGRENLAANGHDVPGIEGMIMEGIVWGDATLSCVRAVINSASFIFQDGRIVSHRTKKGSKGRSKDSLAYLTDKYGSTCIPGEYITNAPKVLTANVLADIAAGAADAYANNETTSSLNSSGGVNTSVTGNSGKYVVGNAVSSGANSIADYIRQRNLDIWDSILVKSGLQVVVHLQQDLHIDYDRSGRKITYLKNNKRHGLMD